jgi:hypothetical protein
MTKNIRLWNTLTNLLFGVGWQTDTETHCELIAYTIWSNLTSYVSFCSYLSGGENDLSVVGCIYRFLCSKIRTESNGQSKYWVHTVKHKRLFDRFYSKCCVLHDANQIERDQLFQGIYKLIRSHIKSVILQYKKTFKTIVKIIWNWKLPFSWNVSTGLFARALQYMCFLKSNKKYIILVVLLL